MFINFKMKKITTLFLSLISVFAIAQTNISTQSVTELFGSDGEIYFALPGAVEQAGVLTKIISIDRISGDTVFAYANKKEFEILRQSENLNFISLPHPGDLIVAEMTSDPRQVLDWNYYPTYPAYEDLMEQFAADYPEICTLHTIGTLPSGRKLLALRISDNVNADEDEPEFLYTSTIHGDETTGYVLLLHLADYLLTNYNQDPRVTSMVNNTDIWINPLANPDGTYNGGNNSVNGARRGNANNIDLNRNYPDPADGPNPDGNAWQPETVAFMNFAESRDFVMGANFHGGIEVVNYPWDTWSRLAADDNWWVMVSREYADTAQAFSPPGYMDDLENGITNGYAWYRITGGRQDYMNYFQQCREVTLEVSNTKLPPASQLLNFWEYNYRSMLNYLEQVKYGVRGIVSDTITGEPIHAQIFINNHDKDSSMVFSSLPVGNYHRLLKSGTYNLTFFADGYLPRTINNVVVTDKSTVRLDVKLWDGSAIPAFTASATTISVGGEVQFSDISGGNPSSRLWTFEGGSINSSVLPNPVVQYNQPGTWDVSLYVQNVIGGNLVSEPDYITVTPDYYIGGEGATTCYARFFDSNGPELNYGDNENLTTTFVGADPDKVLRIHFTEFDVEMSNDCEKDALFIYDGPDATYPLLGKFCGNEVPADLLTSVGGGAVTFVFHSDEANNFAGWSAVVTCDSGVGIALNEIQPKMKMYPNPAGEHGFILEAEEKILSVELSDLFGKQVYFDEPNQNQVIISGIPFRSGVYTVRALTAKGVVSRKLMIVK